VNLNDVTEFRNKLDFLVKKVTEIQLQVAVLKAAPQDAKEPAMWTARQVAQFIGINISTVWAYVKEQPGFPQPVKLTPRTTRFDREEVQAWCESVRKTPKKVRPRVITVCAADVAAKIRSDRGAK
jgi:predicted DNA-binding transcriptional regulator AlpA